MQPRERPPRGFASVQLVVASGLVLVLLALVAQLLVGLYARAVVRGALDEGARAGARVGAGPTECEDRARDAAAALLAGPLGERVAIRCADDGRWVVARAEVDLPGFGALLPGGWHFDVRAVASREVAP